jgi:NAD(P)H-hydrate epimerase
LEIATVKVVTVEQMQAIESSSDAAGHTYSMMMEQAGKSIATVLMERMSVAGKSVLILIGPGNNGGDGLVAARYLAQADAKVSCYLSTQRTQEKDQNLTLVHDLGIPCSSASDDSKRRTLRRLASEADVIIDALLGTGAKPPLRDVAAEILKTVGQITNRRSTTPLQHPVRLGGLPEPSVYSRPMVVAVDGPSGLDFDTGELDDAALPADLTVTFAYPKLGHFSFPGASSRGELVVVDIGTDPSLAAHIQLEVATPAMIRETVPARPLDGHKGTFGKALIVAGSANYTGAARLAGSAAVRSGVGLVTMGIPASIHTAVASGLSESTYLLLPHELGAISGSATKLLTQQAKEYTAMLVGPGLGRESETVSFLESLLSGRQDHRAVGFRGISDQARNSADLPPLVLDADGLNILSGIDRWEALLPEETIMTPHPGEMARLMGCSVSEIQADRVNTAVRQAQAWKAVVVLKGAYTVVAGPGGSAILEPFANPGMASAGTGDVLAGIIVGLRAQGLESFPAAVAGAYLHGLAGEIAAHELGSAGMAAGDLVSFLPAAWRHMTSE